MNLKITVLAIVLLGLSACRNTKPQPPIKTGEYREASSGDGIIEVGIKESRFSVLYDSADKLSNAGQFEAAVEVYTQLCQLEDTPMKTYAYLGLGTAQQQNNNAAAAIEAYQQSVLLDSTNKDSYVSMGSAYSSSRNYTDAIRCYEKAIAIDSNDANPYWGLAVVYRETGDKKRSKECVLRFIALAPNSQYRPMLQSWLEE